MADTPDIFYENAGKLSSKEINQLFPTLEEKCRGIRVFYFNQSSPLGTDHPQDHNSEWKDKLDEGDCLEAGTTVALSRYSKNGAEKEHYLVIVQWDCGFHKSYTEPELKNIRVFDLGPTG